MTVGCQKIPQSYAEGRVQLESDQTQSAFQCDVCEDRHSKISIVVEALLVEV
jgi:hypothetical protein